jgi:hypothetical protein
MSEEAKKFRREYQPKDRNGNPVGPLQVFEADTQKELMDKQQAAHENATVKLHETRRAVKLGSLMEPDQERPIQTFEEVILTADQRVKMTNDLRDPSKTSDAIVQLLEAKLGAPIEVIRQQFREQEIERRAEYMRGQIDLFKNAHPEYVESDYNMETMVAYLNKHRMALTKKNLEIAFDDLVSSDQLTIQAPKQAVPVPTPVVENNGNPLPETIPPVTTTVPAITGEPTDPRPRSSSSGLSNRDSSAVPMNEPLKAKGITPAEINAMNLEDYTLRMKDPAFREAVDKLYAA